MNELVDRVTNGLTELIRPHISRPEYGGLSITGTNPDTLPSFNNSKVVTWHLLYDNIITTNFGSKIANSTSMISASYNTATRKFEYLPIEGGRKETDDPEEVLRYFKERLELIRSERLEFLKNDVTNAIRNGITLEKALDRLRKFGAHTEGELNQYEEFYANSQLLG